MDHSGFVEVNLKSNIIKNISRIKDIELSLVGLHDNKSIVGILRD
jgi:hypothetical protein